MLQRLKLPTAAARTQASIGACPDCPPYCPYPCCHPDKIGRQLAVARVWLDIEDLAGALVTLPAQLGRCRAARRAIAAIAAAVPWGSAGTTQAQSPHTAGPGDGSVTIRGLASWYGDELAGRPTASGEPFDPWASTCAHRWIPFGTWLRIERTDRPDRRTWARVNDRGPWVKGRVLDLSQRVMARLGGLDDGLVPVLATLAGAPAWCPGVSAPQVLDCERR